MYLYLLWQLIVMMEATGQPGPRVTQDIPRCEDKDWVENLTQEFSSKFPVEVWI